ncbi:hypothetical protein DAPPUDRAFT_268091 [Daphnia pulex]|uniref:C2 domain-containing protein n=1 Tax=Daphnia pulex TaxID=6669 RepID=E9HX96_DAPPU|nr:hypothetical protein DAPPUDRAFT_268091 [Daphnia pulex]|eukprot:EFX63630.1 hypothetical protein DAPPUDRAFT_268091 [Daphnia pulex]
MTPDEQMEKNQEEEKEGKEEEEKKEEEIEKEKNEGGEEEVKEEEEKEEEKENEGGEGGEEEEEDEEDEDLLTGNKNPIKVVNTPKLVEMKVVRGVNFPKAKDSDQYYLSVLVEEMRGKFCYQNQTKKFKSKTIRDRWNKNFTIQTQHPESSQITIKVKKSSIFGLKKSTVGFVKMAVSDLMHDENGHVSALKMQLNDESNNPVGEAYLELDMKVGDLPEVVPSPAEPSRNHY